MMKWDSSSWESGRNSGGASNSGDCRGGWQPPLAGGTAAGSDWGWLAPPAYAIHMNEAFGRGYEKGFSAGFSKGHAWAADAEIGKGKADATWGAIGKGKAGRKSCHDEEAEASESDRKPKKKKKGSGWEQWKKKYTPVDPATEKNYFYTRLGEKDTQPYPKEIQDELLKKKAESEDEMTSKDLLYDMTDGYFYNLRIFGGDETEKWEETLSKIKAGDGEEKGTLVGAQWNTKDATADVPNVFDEKVRYRPIFYCGVWA